MVRDVLRDGSEGADVRPSRELLVARSHEARCAPTDKLIGGDGVDRLFGEGGDDYLRGDASDWYTGGAGRDPLEFIDARLARSLFEAGLIDEIGFNIHPVLLGSGIPLFHPMNRQIDLELLQKLLGEQALKDYQERNR